MKIISNIIEYLLFIIIIALLSIAVIFTFNKKLGRVTFIKNYTLFINTGTSMVPTINPGDLLVVKRQESYITGDMITYTNDDNVRTTHRIINTEGGYTTKGDSNNYIDGTLVKSDKVYGKVVKIIPDIYSYTKYLYIIIPILIIIPIGFWIIKKVKNVRTSNN